MRYNQRQARIDVGLDPENAPDEGDEPDFTESDTADAEEDAAREAPDREALLEDLGLTVEDFGVDPDEPIDEVF